MIDFYDLFELAQIKAIESAISPSLDSIWRMKAREYSVMFYTPLHVVMKELDPSMVLQALYEAKYPPSIVDEELEELLDKLNLLKDPNYSRMSKEDTEDLVDSVLNKEIKRLGKKKTPTQETIKQEIKASEAKPKISKSGSMNFGELEKMDSVTESNKNNFDK